MRVRAMRPNVKQQHQHTAHNLIIKQINVYIDDTVSSCSVSLLAPFAFLLANYRQITINLYRNEKKNRYNNNNDKTLAETHENNESYSCSLGVAGMKF
jgi:hypothetical protein